MDTSRQHEQTRLPFIEPQTRLVDKQFSPLVIRKYTHWGAPVYVAMITDDDLSDLDVVVAEWIKEWSGRLPNEIQEVRNAAGYLTTKLVEHYRKTEGAAVIIYADKMFVSSLFGDFMNHTSNRIELYSLLVMSTGV